jgi:hypothetical protein
LGIRRHLADQLAMAEQALEGSFKPGGVERVRRCAHDFDIVVQPPDNIPRTMGFKFLAEPPIDHLMLPAPKPAWLPLGTLLVRKELISNEQLELALLDQQKTGLRLGELLVNWGWVDSAAISQALAEQYELEFVDIDGVEIDPEATKLLSGKDARHYDAIPIRFLADGSLQVGVSDPTDVGACDELRTKLGAVSLVVVDQHELHRALAREYPA